LQKIVFILLSTTAVLCEPISAFDVRIAVEKGCGSTYTVGDSIVFHVYLGEGAYVDLWVATSDGMQDIVRNTFLCAGAHTFSGTVGPWEGTHTVYVKARNPYGAIENDSCSFYVSNAPLPEPPFVSEPGIADSDGDSISDSDDQCHNPGCHEVDPQGCPKDSDSDGVWDCDDACDFFPGIPANNGCPELVEEKGEDSDGDGWPDEQELRAGTNPNSVDTDEDGIWDPKDPNPLKPEENTAEGHDQQVQQSLMKNQSEMMVPIALAVTGLVAGYYLFRKGNEKKKQERMQRTVKKIKEKKKEEQMRKLKARFVYGELSRDEYRKKLKELDFSNK